MAKYVLEQTFRGNEPIDLYAKHLQQRRVFILGAINDEMANDLLTELLYLGEEEPITVYINSPGGQVQAGLAVYDMLQSLTCPVTYVCIGMAASMAAVIFSGGAKGNRLMLPHSKLMIHEPLLANGVTGNASSLQNLSKDILETRDLINGLLAKHTGKTLEEINEATSYDHVMNTEQAMEFGMADKILERLPY